jgi:hypothetical protein
LDKNVMPTELEFTQIRLRLVQERMDDPEAQIEPKKRLALQREFHLLQKVLDELPEGEVLLSLEAWRIYLGKALADHKIRYRTQQEAFDRWLRLSKNRREQLPKPEPPPLGIRVPDHKGNMWVIDDRFLAMMDDLNRRLRRWLASES